MYSVWNILQTEPKDFSRIIYGENVFIGAGNKFVGIQTGQDDKTISQGVAFLNSYDVHLNREQNFQYFQCCYENYFIYNHSLHLVH